MRSDFRKASLITAVKTPFKLNGGIDLEAYERLVRRQIEHGVDGIVVGGTTGEGHLLSWDEHIMLIAFSVRKFGRDILIIGNTGSNNTREAAHATEQGFAVGMHAALQINPYYGKTSKEGLLRHFGRVLEFGPAMVYNVPLRTAQDIGPDIIEKLADHKNFLGVKECAGNDRIKRYQEQGIACWTGVDEECDGAKHKSGACGVVSVAANFYPATFRTVMDDSSSDLIQRLQEFLRLLYSEPNPIGLNTLAAMSGLALPVMRLPYAPMGSGLRRQISDEVARLARPETPPDVRVLDDKDFLLV